MEIVQLARATVAQVRSIHLVFKSYGWATFYVDDAQGTLAVESDWGSYAHRWGRGAWLGVEPHDLSLALATRLGIDYVARKLFLGRENELRAYDEKATERRWREDILQGRRRGWILRGDARDAWDALADVDFSSGPELVWHEAPRELRDVIGDPCEAFVYTETPRFLTVRNVLLPAFLAALRAELASRGSAGAVEEARS
jgi:hypothetical protein